MPLTETWDGRLVERFHATVQDRSEATHSALNALCRTSALRDTELFAVGGVIRDLLLDPPIASGPLDLDLAVDDHPAPFYAALAKTGATEFRVHERFVTASARFPDGSQIDLVRTRRERYHSPGALPQVSPAPIEIDLRRRDFTVNAAALALTGERAGLLLDPHDAAADIHDRCIRSLHSNSFRDDPTRLIRAARYAARIGGHIASATRDDARRHRHHLQTLSPARFGDAWRLLLQEPNATDALSVARSLNLTRARVSSWTLRSAVLDAACSPQHFWAASGLCGTNEQAELLVRSVGLNRHERRALEAGASLRRCRRRIAAMRRPSQVAATLRPFPDTALEAAAAIWDGASGMAISQFLSRRSAIESPIPAHRLVALGVAPGRSIGRWLRRIEAALWDSELDPADADAVAQLEERIRWSP